MTKILIVDDEPAISASLAFALDSDYDIYEAANSEQALAIMDSVGCELVLLDLKLGAEDGLEVLQRIKQLYSAATVIIMTAYGTIQSSVTAMKLGAFYYITKPINIEELKAILANADQYAALQSKVRYLHDKLADKYTLAGIVGRSAPMRAVFALIEKVSATGTNVFITGESGTGKELVARAIHFAGPRRNEPFEVVNCAAIPSGILESELFGYEKGAFTGATHSKKGIFERAHNGTLFLDEIAEMDANLQSKLLRIVQDKEVKPLGGGSGKKVNVRLIAASNKDIAAAVRAGRFREDLLFRLNVINIELPPLRSRQGDIALLVQYFIEKYNKEMGRSIVGIKPAALAALENYEFKGNVRELANIIERALVLTENEWLELSDLPKELIRPAVATVDPAVSLMVPMGTTLAMIEKQVILATLESLGGSRKETALLLGISERNLRYKLKEYGVN